MENSTYTVEHLSTFRLQQRPELSANKLDIVSVTRAESDVLANSHMGQVRPLTVDLYHLLLSLI